MKIQLSKLIAAIIVVTHAGQITAPGILGIALAAENSCDQACNAAIDGEFKKLVSAYINAYANGDRLRRATYANRIKKAIFAKPGTQEYVAALKFLDSLAGIAPEAIYDLAKSLQLHWENNYAVGLSAKRATRVSTGSKIGAVLAITVLGASLVRNPRNAPKYFRAIRWLLPAAGAQAGVFTADALNKSGMLDKHIPIAPAHVMKLGVTTEEFRYDDNSIVEMLTSIGAGFAAAEVAYLLVAARTAKYVNLAITPAKINPIALIASIVVGIAVERGIDYEIDRRNFNRLSGKVKSARNIVDWGIAAGDDARIYMGADGLVKTSANLADYLNRGLEEEMKFYNEEVSKAAMRHGITSSGNMSRTFQWELDRLTENFSRKAREILNDQDNRSYEDYRATLVLQYLQNNDEDSIDELGEDARIRAQSYRAGFKNWLHKKVRGAKINETVETEYFQAYIKGLLSAKNRQLATEFRDGKITRNANHVLLQSSAFLRSLDKEYLEGQVDDLMGMIARNDLITAGVTNTNGSKQSTGML